MKKEEIEKHLSDLKNERSKLFKVKSASPKDIQERVAKINRRILDLENKLHEI